MCVWVHTHAFAVVTEHWMLQRIESPVVSRWASFFNCRLTGCVCVCVCGCVLGWLRLALLLCNHTSSPSIYLSPTHRQNRTNTRLYRPFETGHTLNFWLCHQFFVPLLSGLEATEANSAILISAMYKAVNLVLLAQMLRFDEVLETSCSHCTWHNDTWQLLYYFSNFCATSSHI